MDALLQVSGLTKCYPDFSLSDVSFEIPPGYVMGLIGPNGAGKTTTLRTILGLVRRDGGRVRIAGVDPESDGAAARAAIGFVHDEPRFHRYLSLRSIAGMVGRFYERWNEKRFRSLASAFGLDTSKRFGTLSRGTRMKFAATLALSHDARLILMDEPTAGLDPVFRRSFLGVLQDQLQNARASILFSTHVTADLDRIADYITLLQRGRVVFSESKDDILDRWVRVSGGLELLTETSQRLFRGIRRRAHGFEAVTDDAEAVRRTLPGTVIIERPSLEDIVLLTSRGEARA